MQASDTSISANNQKPPLCHYGKQIIRIGNRTEASGVTFANMKGNILSVHQISKNVNFMIFEKHCACIKKLLTFNQDPRNIIAGIWENNAYKAIPAKSKNKITREISRSFSQPKNWNLSVPNTVHMPKRNHQLIIKTLRTTENKLTWAFHQANISHKRQTYNKFILSRNKKYHLRR